MLLLLLCLHYASAVLEALPELHGVSWVGDEITEALQTQLGPGRLHGWALKRHVNIGLGRLAACSARLLLRQTNAMPVSHQLCGMTRAKAPKTGNDIFG